MPSQVSVILDGREEETRDYVSENSALLIYRLVITIFQETKHDNNLP
jgi:hypothetical protein